MQNGHFMDFSLEESGIVAVPLQWTSGAIGAVPALSAFRYSQHVVSVTRNGAGNFTVVYDTGVVGILGLMTDNVIQAIPSGGGLYGVIMSSTLVTGTSLWNIVIQTQNPAGTATDTAAGDIVMLCLLLQYMDAIQGK